LRSVIPALAQAFDFGKPFTRRREGLGEGAECGEQLLGERFQIPSGQGAEQHKFEQLVVRHRLAACVAETLAQPLAVPMIMRGRILGLGRRLGLAVAGHVRCHRLRPRSPIAGARPRMTAPPDFATGRLATGAQPDR
jgi:hypothetical protein